MFSWNSFSKASFSIITFVLLLVAVSCSKKPIQQQIPTVTAAPVIEKTISYAVPIVIVGQAIAKQHVQLQVRVASFFEKMNFIEGSFVKKGQLLYQIQKEQWIAEKDQAQAQVLSAQTTYDNALIEYDRQQNLWSSNATSKKDLDNSTQNKYTAEGGLFNAKAQLALAKLNLSYTDMYAPFNGRTGVSSYCPPNIVNTSSKPLAEVIMIDPIWIEFESREDILIDILQYKNSQTHMSDKKDPTFNTKGATVKLTLSNGTEYPETGVIDFVSNQTDPQTDTIQMRATFNNPQQLLLSGDYITVTIEKVNITPSLPIHQASMQNDQIGTYVFVINKNSIVEQKYITLGQVYGSCIGVRTGLNKDDLVMSNEILRVRDGSKVSYKIEQPNIEASTDPQIINEKKMKLIRT